MAVTAAWNALTGLTRNAIRLATVLMTPTAGLTVRSGVIPGGTPMLLTGSVMTGSVAPGRAVVQGTSAQGAYPVVVDAATAITVANGHASLGRVDTVWLVVLDTDIDASGFRQAQIVYQQGTAAASPVAPTAPASGLAYLRLWDILVPAGASTGTPINWGSALTDRRTYTVSVGGIVPDAAAAGAYAGQYRDGGSLERYSGSAWESRVYLSSSGQIVIGGDVNLYRSGANQLKSDDGLTAVTLTATSMAPVQVSDATTRIVNSAAFADGPSVLSTTIVVPPSGRVDVSGMVTQYNPLAQYCYSDLNITGTTSGAVRTSSDVGALKMVNFNSAGANEISQCLRFYVTAIPGETLTIKWQHHTTGSSSGQFGSRTIVAIPMVV